MNLQTLILWLQALSSADLDLAVTLSTRHGPCGPVAVAGISLGAVPSDWQGPLQEWLAWTAVRTMRRLHLDRLSQ